MKIAVLFLMVVTWEGRVNQSVNEGSNIFQEIAVDTKNLINIFCLEFFESPRLQYPYLLIFPIYIKDMIRKRSVNQV